MRRILLAAVLALLSLPALADGLFDIVTKGSTSRSVTVDIIDSTDGTPEVGVVFNTSGIDLWYRREGAAVTSITEVTLAALTTAYTSGGFLAIANGKYRLDLPDAAYATGANYVDFGGTVTGMIVIGGRVRLTDFSLEDAVRGTAGTALPNAAAGASGGVLISGSNSGTTTLAALTVSGATTLTGNVAMAAGLNITQSTSNTAALVVTGNGTGNGATFTSGSGATGAGLSAVAASTNGSGVSAAGAGTGSGVTYTGGATGHGLNAVGGATSGSGLRAVASTSGSGIVATGVGTTQPGLLATGGATSSAGISAAGGGTGGGILATGGATGHGMRLVGGSTSGNGLSTSFTAPSAGAPEMGFDVSGTLSGTHGSTTADLGTNAPGTVSDIVGHTLRFPTRNLSRAVTAYDTTTGIATFDAIDSDITLTNADPWILFGTAPSSGSGSGLDAAGVRAALGFATANADTQFSTLQSDTNDIQTRLPSALVSGRIDSSTGAMAANVMTAAAAASDLTTELQTGLATAAALTTVSNNIGTPSNLGGGATLAANAADIEAQTDDIGAAGAGLTAADDAVMTRLGAPAGATVSADVADLRADIPVALISGRMASQVGGYESGQVPLQPTVAGRTLDVTATGGAGIDWANVESPTTALGLTGTTFSITQQIASVSGAVAAVTAGVTVTTNNDKTGYALSAAGVDAVWDEPQAGHATPNTYGDNLDSPVSGVSTGGVSVGDIADAVMDEALLGHSTAGSAGKALADAATSAVGTGTGLTSIPWNPSWDAEVQSEAEDAVGARLEQAVRADAAVLNCAVNTANFAGSSTTVACMLTDRDGGAITAASGDLEGRELLILSGAQIYEGRFINDTTWDAANSELRLTLSRALPASLADAVTAIVR